MAKTMILAIGGAGCNMAETIMREASAHWVREATYFFPIQDESLNRNQEWRDEQHPVKYFSLYHRPLPKSTLQLQVPDWDA